LFDLPETPLFSRTLPEGILGFLFIIDYTPDGLLGVTWYDFVLVISQVQDSRMENVPELNEMLQNKMRELMKN
jgi:hypothetical protein